MIGAAIGLQATKNIFADKPIGGLGRMCGERTACLLALVSWGSLMGSAHASPTRMALR